MLRMLLVCCLLLATSGPAAAQSSPWQEEERTTAGWTFTPGVSLGLFWDSGIETPSNPVVEALFQSWAAQANPRAELDYNGRRTHFNLGYSGSFEKHWAEDAYWEQRGRVGLRRTISPRFSVSGNAAYAAVPTTDRLELVQGVVPFVQIDSRYVDAAAGFTWQAGPRTSVFGNYQFHLLTLDSELAPITSTPFGTLRDGHSHAPSVGFMRQWTSRLGIGATGELRREVIGSDGGDRFDVRNLTAEVSYQWSPVMTVSGGGGVSQLEDLYTAEQTTAPTFHAGFSRVMRQLRLDARYQRGFQQLFGFGSLATTDVISGDAVIPLLDRLYFMNIIVAYQKSQPVEALAIGHASDTIWTNVAVGRRLAERLRAEAFASIAHQSGDSGGVNRTRVGIQITTSKPLRIE